MFSITQLPALLGMDFLRFGGGGGFAMLLFVLVIALLVGWLGSGTGASARH